MAFKTLITLTILVALNSCSKNKAEQSSVLHSMYKAYRNGEIDQCRLNGNTVYVGGQNAYDAGATIYDSLGHTIGSCNYGWGPVDTLCKQLQACETIYRCHGAISGEPFIDKYGLSR